MSNTVPYTQLLHVLTELVDRKQSGTLFIHSDCNHAITFALDAGRIFAVFHGARRGRKAIPMISNISGGTYKFESSSLNNLSQELPSTPKILNLLRTPQTVETLKTPAKSSLGQQTGISEGAKNRSFDCTYMVAKENRSPGRARTSNS